MAEGDYVDVKLTTEDVEGNGAASQAVVATETGSMMLEPLEVLMRRRQGR
jgi:hypothetical protein